MAGERVDLEVDVDAPDPQGGTDVTPEQPDRAAPGGQRVYPWESHGDEDVALWWSGGTLTGSLTAHLGPQHPTNGGPGRPGLWP